MQNVQKYMHLRNQSRSPNDATGRFTGNSCDEGVVERYSAYGRCERVHSTTTVSDMRAILTRLPGFCYGWYRAEIPGGRNISAGNDEVPSPIEACALTKEETGGTSPTNPRASTSEGRGGSRQLLARHPELLEARPLRIATPPKTCSTPSHCPATTLMPALAPQHHVPRFFSICVLMTTTCEEVGSFVGR